jgi:hypothetical protein
VLHPTAGDVASPSSKPSFAAAEIDALARFARAATVISESPDEASSQAIRAVLEGGGASSARRAS